MITAQQSRMARAALNWSIDDLAEASGVGRATIARFELGNPVRPATIDRLQSAFEAKRVKFLADGPLAGAVYGGLRSAK